MHSTRAIAVFGILTLPAVFLVWSIFLPSRPISSIFPTQPLFMTAAVGEENEDEEGDADSETNATTKTIEVIKETVTYVPVTETVIITKEDYQRDTDGDLLVDAIDPDPLIKQSEYFTDSDGDGVPNALDQHPDEDDFAYYEFETDDNNNGIIDSYEQE